MPMPPYISQQMKNLEQRCFS